MCGRYALSQVAELPARFGLGQLTLDLAPRYNIAPGQFAPVILQAGDERRAEVMRWGLVPAWSREAQPGYATFNARAEGIAAKPAFRGPIRRQRCLVPADGFYEWRKDDARKQPYYIHRTDGALFAFAGLYDRYRQPDGEILQTYTIITTTPNALIAPLHHRMAVVLPPADEDEWLDPAVTDPEQIARLLRPSAPDVLAAYPVGRLVNDGRREGPELIAPLAAPPESAPLF